MDIKTFAKEIWDLLKNEKKYIFIITGIAAVLAIAVQLLFYTDMSSSNSQQSNNQEKPAETKLFIETQELGLFTNSYLVEILMQQPGVVQTIEEESQVEVQQKIDEYGENNQPIYSTEDPVNVERNTSSNVFTVTVQLGSEEENIGVAQAYSNWLEESSHSFFENKSVYMVSDVYQVEDPQTVQTSSSISIISLILYLIIGIFGGLVLGVSFVILKALLSNKIEYGFTYGWKADDVYLKQSDDDSFSKISKSILKSEYDNILVVSQYELPDELKTKLNQYDEKNVTIYSSIVEVPVSVNSDEFVLIIQRSRTDKSWYHKQRKELRVYPSSLIKIIETSN